MTWLVVLTLFLAAAGVTGLIRLYALKEQLLDEPNERSSHLVATPRGGGVSIVVVTAVALLLTGADSADRMPVAIVLAGVCVGILGFGDDHRHLSPSIRLAGHVVAACVAVWAVGPPPPELGREMPVLQGFTGTLLSIFYLTWLINLTNFMDGIDGIAGVQAVSVCAVGTLLYALTLPGDVRWLEPAVLAAAAAGFLVWNWPPARIFMGDGGSGFLGFMIGVLTIRAAYAAPRLAWCWLLMSGVFVVDASLTLFVRLVRRERIHQAHRNHAYQYLSQRWGAHKPVTILVMVVNTCWLLPLAWLVATGRFGGLLLLTIGYLPIAIGVGWCVYRGYQSRAVAKAR
jgi:Fuc2NAc and GlcNAc transferase